MSLAILQITSLYFELAQAYRDGLGTPRNVEKFWEFMGKAAKLKDTEAMFELAEAHTNADLGQQSPERAADWTIKGAAAGDPVASIKVARRYQFGNGVKANPDKFFEWADKAARSRLTEAETAQNVGWGAYEDYPDALMALADAYRQRGALAKAEKTALLAADAARDAIEFAKREGDAVNVGKSKSLPEIMLARLREFRTRNGDIDKRRSAAYLQWLQAINEGIRRVYFSEDGHNAIPQGLVQAIFELAVAYEKGIGTPVNKAKTAEYMAQAAKAGHGEAAYRCAMKYYKAGKMLEFEEYLAMGASDFRVRHALALKDCELPRSEFLTALDVLSALRNTVHEIRSSRHTITPQEAPNGVAHYTGNEGLASMLGDDSTQARNVVRLYNTAYVNDPREGKRLKTFEKKRFVNPLRDFFATNETSHEAISWQGQEYVVFVACFSLSWDNLDLWRFYGRDGAGYSVVSPVTAFDTDSTQDMLHGGTRADKTSVMPPITLYKVLYEDDDAELALRELAQPLTKVRSLMNRVSPEAREHLRSIAAAIVSELLYLYKNKDYKQEEEVRAVAARTLRDPELRQHAKAFGPFAKLFIETGPILFQQPGSSIIIGPKVEKSKAIMLDIKHRLEKGGFASCVVERSKVSYG